MEIDILDTAMNPNGMSYFDLTERIETFEKAGAQSKDIKHISSYQDGRNFTTAILYEEPTIIQQHSFYTKAGEKQVTQLGTSAHFRSSHLDQIARVLKIGGICISFGWNTNGVGKNRGFVTEEILIVNHGGSHNDTLVTADRKVR